MILTIIIAFISLIGLVTLHEFGHFITAKKFGVKVEEFGVGFPPRIFGKKFGETIYSLNLLPFGAFVKMPGEIGRTDDPSNFSNKAVWKRALIVAAGVISFWLIAAILFGIVFKLGTPVAISDDVDSNLKNPQVQIVNLSADSPAKAANLQPGDTIVSVKLKNSTQEVKITKVQQLQEFTNANKGQEIILTIQRGKEISDVSLTPRVNPPIGEGPMGVALVRTAVKSYPWYSAPWQGIITTGNLTIAIAQGYFDAIKNLIMGQPTGVQLTGPVGVFQLFTQASQLGASYFLQFVGMVAVYIAIFNILPIPSVDGGKLIFLGIEAIRRKPVSEKLEQRVTTVFFALLLVLMAWVTFKDIMRIF